MDGLGTEPVEKQRVSNDQIVHPPILMSHGHF
jgi:hypothetical protein